MSSGGHHYWTYWLHKIQQLWHEHEDLKKRLDAVESRLGMNQQTQQQAPQQGPPQQGPPPQQQGPPQQGPPLKEMELTACMALKELGGNASIQEINAHLGKTRNINEDVKTTLIRLKGSIQKGYIQINPETKRFSLARENFTVS